MARARPAKQIEGAGGRRHFFFDPQSISQVTIAGTWSEAELAGHTCDVFEPERPHPQGFVAIYLHGVHLNRLVEQPAFGAEFARHGLRVVCPRTELVDRSHLPRVRRRDHGRAVRARPGAAVRGPAVGRAAAGRGPAGHEHGGPGSMRMWFDVRGRFRSARRSRRPSTTICAWNEGDETLPEMYSDAEAARQDSATLHVHPLNWPRNMWFCCDPADYRWHAMHDKLRMKLAALGIPHECDLETSGGGHGFAYYGRMAPAALEFLVQRLEQESRRV